MTKPVRLTEQAEDDVLEIWEYIAADDSSAADRLVDRLAEIYEKLARVLSRSNTVPACDVFPWANTSSSTRSQMTS